MELGSHSELDCLSLQFSTAGFPDSIFVTLFRTAVKSALSMAQPDSVPHSNLKCPFNGTTTYHFMAESEDGCWKARHGVRLISSVSAVQTDLKRDSGSRKGLCYETIRSMPQRNHPNTFSCVMRLSGQCHKETSHPEHHPNTFQRGAGGHDHTYVLLFHGVKKVDGSVVGSPIIEKHNETTLKGERRKKVHTCVSVHNRYA